MTEDGKRRMLAFARYAAQTWGSALSELIYTPMGFGIKNGAQVPPYAAADHYGHAHMADGPGGPGGLGGPPLAGGFMAAASPSAAASRSTSSAGTIVERALALQTNIIDKRLERSR